MTSIRHRAVAGRFYASNRQILKTDITGYLSAFDGQDKTEVDRPLAPIVPHAGYIYSGSVAAAG